MNGTAGTGSPAAVAVDAPGTGLRRVPGQPDMWVFVLFETLIFTGYFAFYLYDRARHPEEYAQAQEQLYLSVGIIETLTLLSSSWMVARCVEALRSGQWQSALRNAYATVALGVVFLLLKLAEWTTELNAGYGFTTNEFFSHYYFLTALHLLHLLIGFVCLGVLIHQLRSVERRSQELVETCATYWHTVDYLWMLIFALLYVVR